MTEGKIIEIQDVQAGRVKETTMPAAVRAYDPLKDLREALLRTQVEKGLRNLQEAYVLTPDANSLLRDGLRFIAFQGYNEIPATFTPFVTRFSSTRPHEEYLRDGTVGLIPQTKSGTETPRIMSQFDGGVKIENQRYAAILEVTGDDLRFDRLGIIATQTAPELGRAMRMTEEQVVYNALTTTANFTRSNTTRDNDVGANTQNLTFNAANLETAYTVISTSKDRSTGAYLGMAPDTLVVGPRLMFAAQQLLLGSDMLRTHGNTSAEVRGTSTYNPYRGMITRIVVSPWLSDSFNWALIDSRRMGIVFQEVEPMTVSQSSQDQSDERFFTRDIIRFRVTGYFGVGIADDRPLFYSNSTTAPTVS